MLTIKTRPAPENFGAFCAFMMVTANTGPVIIKTSKDTRNAAALIEAVFLMMFVILYPRRCMRFTGRALNRF
jgi:hypothetical protein